MIKNRTFFKHGFLLTAALILVSLFVSCSSGQKTSFISKLDEIDVYIAAGNTGDALNQLKKSEKTARSPMDFLGLYRRYLLLGENQKAENILVNSIKKHSSSLELKAVYVHHLLENNRITEALAYSKDLKDSEYASLYAENVIRFAKENHLSADLTFNPPKRLLKGKALKKNQLPSQKETDECFYDLRFVPLYASVWNVNHNSLWLKNAASLYMLNGEYAKASVLRPDFKLVNDLSDSYFWGTVLYDSGRYTESLDYLLLKQKDWRENILSVKAMALSADNLYILGEDEQSEELRKRLIEISASVYGISVLVDSSAFDSEAEKNIEADNEAAVFQRDDLITSERDTEENPLKTSEALKTLDEILPVIYLNSALFEKKSNNITGEYLRLTQLVNLYPFYEPGLASYGQFALETLRRPPEEELLQLLRRSGLRTQKMEENDALPEIQLEDALNRINEALKMQKTPDLVVLKEEMYLETHRDIKKGEKSGRAWKLLEENETGKDLYPPEIMKYVLLTLISTDNEEEAYSCFKKYVQAEHSSTVEELFAFEESTKSAGEKSDESSGKPALWEYEACAWFLLKKDVKKSLSLYEYIISHYGDRTPGTVTAGQNDSVICAMMNAAVIYSGFARYEEADELLVKASGRAADPYVKAEILYRSAELDLTLGNERNAVRSLKYAVSLNPKHNKARLLLKTLTGKTGS